MIKYFRKIRQNLINEGKTTKYFKYAIGEIILVVIGILIALQINNWNERRINQNKEQVILKALKTDFKANLNLLKRENLKSEEAYNASLALKTLIKPNVSEFSGKQIDTLISVMFEYQTFDPIQGAIVEVLSSGQLNIIQSKQIKNDISRWSSIMNDLKVDSDIINDYAFNHLIPYLSKNASISNMLIGQENASTQTLKTLPPSNFEANYGFVMTSHEFENMVNWHSINVKYLITEQALVQSYLENVLVLLDSKIKIDND
ncbi:MAG: DUF6090 family protein [Maribacter sp.]